MGSLVALVGAGQRGIRDGTGARCSSTALHIFVNADLTDLEHADLMEEPVHITLAAAFDPADLVVDVTVNDLIRIHPRRSALRYYFKTRLVRFHHRSLTTSESPLNHQFILTRRQRIVPGLCTAPGRSISKHKPISHLRFICF